jgi:hypothetical protein
MNLQWGFLHACSSLPRLPLAFKGKVSLESVHEAKILEKAHKIQSCEMQGFIGKKNPRRAALRI